MSTDFRIIDFNYFFQDEAIISATSADASFPASNVGKPIRSQVWRSSGNFTITTSNNKINFKESAIGVELTATITNGDYTPTTLATEIKTQMEAVTGLGRTYTITYSTSTGKWTITGQTYLDLLFLTGTDIANSLHLSLGFATADYSGAVTYTGAKAAIHTNEAIIIDLLSTEEVDSFAMLFDPKEGIQLTSSAVVSLQGNATPSWTSPAVDVNLSIDEDKDSITHFFSSDQSYRYWRINIVDPSNPDLYVEIGTLMLGNATVLTRCIDSGFTFDLEDNSKVQENNYGHQYVDEYPTLKTLSFSYNILSYVDVQTLDNMFRRVGARVPVYVALDSQEQAFDKDAYSIYGRLEKKLAQGHIVHNYFKTSLVVREIS